MSGMAVAGELRNENAERSGLFGFPKFMFPMSRRRRSIEAVTEGARFQRETPDHRVETARVISINADSMGIPHVRYELEIRKHTSFTRVDAGHRSLALETFAEIYRPVA